MASQIVSKQRVTDHGEVLTAPREVNAMLDLVEERANTFEFRFLEPACGNGNFLAEILERKLRVVGSRYGRSRLDYERNAVQAVCSIYGIDKQEDNVEACHVRLFGIFERHYSTHFKSSAREECRDAVRYILERNIIHGDALSLKTVGPVPRPIIFSDWSLASGSRLKRRDYEFSELFQESEGSQQGLFLREEYSDEGTRSFIPREVKSWPLIHFLKVRQHDE